MTFKAGAAAAADGKANREREKRKEWQSTLNRFQALHNKHIYPLITI